MPHASYMHSLAHCLLCVFMATCRYLDFMTEHLKETCNYELKPELRGELETAILHLEVRTPHAGCTERSLFVVDMRVLRLCCAVCTECSLFVLDMCACALCLCCAVCMGLGLQWSGTACKLCAHA
jgi:hypothetical protein